MHSFGNNKHKMDFYSSDSQIILVTVHFFVPPNYPSQEKPFYEFVNNLEFLTMDQIQTISENFDRLWSENLTMVILFEWVNWLREYLNEIETELYENQLKIQSENQKNIEPEIETQDDVNSNPDLNLENELLENEETEIEITQRQMEREAKLSLLNDKIKNCPKIFHGQPFEDRKRYNSFLASIFIC